MCMMMIGRPEACWGLCTTGFCPGMHTSLAPLKNRGRMLTRLEGAQDVPISAGDMELAAQSLCDLRQLVPQWAFRMEEQRHVRTAKTREGSVQPGWLECSTGNAKESNAWTCCKTLLWIQVRDRTSYDQRARISQKFSKSLPKESG